MKKISVVANVHKPKAITEAKKVIDYLNKREIFVLVSEELAQHVPGEPVSKDKKLFKDSDLIVALGGDGTLLKYSKQAAINNLPILGINLGGLGFLTEFQPEDFYTTLDAIVSGNLTIEKRMMLEVNIKQEKRIKESYPVLNDFVISKGAIARMLHIRVAINNHYLTTYSCDGLILATPTGSTGYSLSAGGPIILPHSENIVLTPICPHTLSNRPLVLSYDSVVEVTLEIFNPDTYLTMDGQIVQSLKENDSITVSRGGHPVQLVLSGHSYFEILREKLGWRGSHLL